MSLMEQTLERLKKDQELAIFIRERGVDMTYWGVLTDYNDGYIYLSLVDMDGLPDGIVIFEKDQLSRIRWGSAKLKSVKKLFDNKGGTLVQPDLCIDDLGSILNSVLSHFEYVGINIEQLDDDALILGEILDQDSEYMIVSEFLNKENRCSSNVLLYISDITGVEAGDTYKEDILTLNKAQKED